MMRHGVSVYMVPRDHGGQQGITVEGNYLPMHYDQEKFYFQISKLNSEEIKTLEAYEINSPHVYYSNGKCIIRNKKEIQFHNIPLIEWRKILGMVPEEVVKRTIGATTQFYTKVESENRNYPRRHLQRLFPGLRNNRLNEMVSSDTFFPSVKSKRGNTCSQLFVGNDSYRWEVYPLKSECQNGTALQDYTRNVGTPNILKSDNAQSQTTSTWMNHCRKHCIESRTTEPEHPWQNPCEKRIGYLGTMLRIVMR